MYIVYCNNYQNMKLRTGRNVSLNPKTYACKCCWSLRVRISFARYLFYTIYFKHGWKILDFNPTTHWENLRLRLSSTYTYQGAKSFRSINLSLFLLKTVEKLVNCYIRKRAIRNSPLYPNQHAYLPSTLTETVLHSLIKKIKRPLFHGLTIVDIFLDTEGADATFTRWVTNMLRFCITIAKLSDDLRKIKVKQWCPRGRVPSPLLSCITDTAN